MTKNDAAETLSMVGHELTGPLASARFHLELVRRQLADAPEPSRRLEVVDHQLERMGRLVGDLLDAQRAVKGRLRCELAVHEISELLRKSMMELAPLAGRRPLELVLPRRARVFARVDPARIEQVVANLIRNAAQHSPQDKPITVRLARRRKNLVISVRDRGTGIASDRLKHIFDAWYSHSPGGLGLGLAIAQRIMLAHNGGIRARSKLGNGTTMSIWLPLSGSCSTL